MKKIILIISAALVVFTTYAQTAVIKDPNAQIRTVSGFHAIEVSKCH